MIASHGPVGQALGYERFLTVPGSPTFEGRVRKQELARGVSKTVRQKPPAAGRSAARQGPKVVPGRPASGVLVEEIASRPRAAPGAVCSIDCGDRSAIGP